MVCADCSVLTEGGVRTWAICERCRQAGGTSLRRAWLGLVLWIVIPAIVLAALAVLFASVARAADELDSLRAHGLERAAQVIARRLRQKQPKMKLSPVEARRVADAILRRRSELPETRALHDLMPRSFVELVRAVEERDLDPGEAEVIARYLSGLVKTLRFGNLERFDENHSHVIGRQWAEIDYSGEGTTWQRQRAAWAPHGVVDFRRATHLHRYFTAEEKLGYFRRIYRPRGRMVDVQAP
jgi:hypothetical protein